MTYPETARYYLGLAAHDASALAATSAGNPVLESLDQTVERATWNTERLT